MVPSWNISSAKIISGRSYLIEWIWFFGKRIIHSGNCHVGIFAIDIIKCIESIILQTHIPPTLYYTRRRAKILCHPSRQRQNTLTNSKNFPLFRSPAKNGTRYRRHVRFVLYTLPTARIDSIRFGEDRKMVWKINRVGQLILPN